MAVSSEPTIKEIKLFIAFNLIPKRLYPPGTNWIATKKFRKFAANFELNGKLKIVFYFAMVVAKLVIRKKVLISIYCKCSTIATF